jgi:hypothetical protein
LGRLIFVLTNGAIRGELLKLRITYMGVRDILPNHEINYASVTNSLRVPYMKIKIGILKRKPNTGRLPKCGVLPPLGGGLVAYGGMRNSLKSSAMKLN